MNKNQQVYFSYAHTKARLANGEDLVVKDNKTAQSCTLSPLFNTISKLSPSSVYEVGYRLGANLVSMKYFLPSSKIAGCEINELYQSYAGQLFDLGDINLEIRDILENVAVTIKNDVVYTVNTVAKYAYDEQKRILLNMKKLASKYVVIMEDKLAEEVLKYAIAIGLKLITQKDGIYTFQVIPPVEKRV